jgi:hypothetical protein
MAKSPHVSRLQRWLGGYSTWYPSADGEYRRTLAGNLFWHPAWETVTWLRWKTGRGPRCGDEYCYRPEDWPAGKAPPDVTAEWRKMP